MGGEVPARTCQSQARSQDLHTGFWAPVVVGTVPAPFLSLRAPATLRHPHCTAPCTSPTMLAVFLSSFFRWGR